MPELRSPGPPRSSSICPDTLTASPSPTHGSSPSMNTASPLSGRTTALKKRIATKQCHSTPTSLSAASSSMSCPVAFTVFAITDSLLTGNAPRTSPKPENASASKHHKTQTTTTTPTNRPTGYCVPPAAPPCESSSSLTPDTHQPLHLIAEATRRESNIVSFNSKHRRRTPKPARPYHRVASPRHNANYNARFTRPILYKHPNTTTNEPNSPATTVQLRTRSHQHALPRRAQIPIARCPASAVSFIEACPTPAAQSWRHLDLTASWPASDNP